MRVVAPATLPLVEGGQPLGCNVVQGAALVTTTCLASPYLEPRGRLGLLAFRR